MKTSKKNLKLIMRLVMRKQETVWTLVLGCCRSEGLAAENTDDELASKTNLELLFIAS